MCRIFHNGIIGNELRWLYDIQVTHTTFIDKLYNLLVILNLTKNKYLIIIILKDASDITKFLRLQVPRTLKDISIYQGCSTTICNVLTSIYFQSETIKTVQSLLQNILGIVNKGICGNNIDLGSGCCQQHQCTST